MRKVLSVLFSILLISLSCAGKTERSCNVDVNIPHFAIIKDNGVAKIKKNGKDFFIKGIGGAGHLDLATSMGANAFRTWDANEEIMGKQLEDARKNDMYMMVGIWLSHEKKDYADESYKNSQRKRVQTLLDAFKTHPNLMIWCLGNEVNLEGADTRETWEFIDELAAMIKEQDSNHPVTTVISFSESALNNIVRYASHIDVVGFNAYGAIYGMKELFDHSEYKGPYMVTEWGTNGHWENGNTEWGAPIEPSSDAKRIEYEKRYTSFIQNNDRCIGSFVFLWGQKQECTPTWYSLFVEKGVNGLPLNGELCPPVEAMEKVWTGKEPSEKAPAVEQVIISGLSEKGTALLSEIKQLKAQVLVSKPNGEELTFVWEILKEATELGVGGSFEPRPERVGAVLIGKSHVQEIQLPEKSGNYRLFAYVLNGKGRVGTANIPFQLIDRSTGDHLGEKMSFINECSSK